MKNVHYILLISLSMLLMSHASYGENELSENQAVDIFVLEEYNTMEQTALEQRAQNGDALAQFYAGQRYLFGRGVDENRAQGVDYIVRSAESGNPLAQNSLGTLYLQKDALPGFNTQLAAHYFELAANQGNSNSYHELAYMYYLGVGVAQDQARAAEYLNLSCITGRKNDCFGWRPQDLEFFQSLL